MCISRMGKQTAVCPYDGILLSNEERATDTRQLECTPKVTLSKRSQTKYRACCMILFMYNSRKCVLVYSGDNQIRSVAAWGQEELARKKDYRKVLENF